MFDSSNVQKMHIANSDRPVEYFSLDIILAVGYRTNSAIAIKFRRWATQTLKEYIIKGFVLNTERLKNPGGWDYFDELLEKIREIRASEKRFYQKVRDLFALNKLRKLHPTVKPTAMLMDILLFAVIFYIYIGRFITGLFFFTNPSAIQGFIIPTWIYTVNR